ncbi:hypothetical protein HHI36_004261 [Cryptolaemus montrouzieri]|uniref:Uncharacterized protein n=1 Tax=Cryptolaemus montrouzieri TaxID=559131 RepID=A0ABD2NRH7_9CUCU
MLIPQENFQQVYRPQAPSTPPGKLARPKSTTCRVNTHTKQHQLASAPKNDIKTVKKNVIITKKRIGTNLYCLEARVDSRQTPSPKLLAESPRTTLRGPSPITTLSNYTYSNQPPKLNILVPHHQLQSNTIINVTIADLRKAQHFGQNLVYSYLKNA